MAATWKRFVYSDELKFPFYIEAGTLDAISLTADSKLPFFDAAGAAKNITLTT